MQQILTGAARILAVAATLDAATATTPAAPDPDADPSGSDLTDEVGGAVEDDESSKRGDRFGTIERSATDEGFELVVWSIYEQCPTGGIDQGPPNHVQGVWSGAASEGDEGNVSRGKYGLHCVIEPVVRRGLLQVGRLQRQSSTQVRKGYGGFMVHVGVAHSRLSRS